MRLSDGNPGEALADWPATRPASGDGAPNIFTPAPAVPAGDGGEAPAELRLPAEPSVTPEVPAAKTEEVEERRYRNGPKRTARLPLATVEEIGGPVTHLGTPNLAAFALARAVPLHQATADNESEALKYNNGHVVKRRPGELLKSYQGFAEDAWERLLCRLIPEGEPLDDPAFRRYYEKARRAVKRQLESELLQCNGPAVLSGDKFVRDSNGRRFQLKPNLRELPGGTAPLPVKQCTGPPAFDPGEEWEPSDAAPGTGPTVDVGKLLERHVARERELHTEFTHALTCGELHHTRRTAEAVRLRQRTNRTGRDGPGFASIGSFRPSEIHRTRYSEAGRKQGRPCFVPWIVADVDGPGPGKDAELNHQLTQRLTRRLIDTFGAEQVRILSTGGSGYHPYIPSGAVGNSVFASEAAARVRLEWLWRRICGEDAELFNALDKGGFEPWRVMTLPGTRHRETNRRALLLHPSDFLGMSRQEVENASAKDRLFYQRAATLPDPTNAPFNRKLTRALLSPIPQQQALSFHTHREEKDSNPSLLDNPPEAGKQSTVSQAVFERLSEGVEESEDWGPSCGWPSAQNGRNFACLVLGRYFAERTAWSVQRVREAVEVLNRANTPPLPGKELARAVSNAYAWVRQRQANEDGRGPPQGLHASK